MDDRSRIGEQLRRQNRCASQRAAMLPGRYGRAVVTAIAATPADQTRPVGAAGLQPEDSLAPESARHAG